MALVLNDRVKETTTTTGTGTVNLAGAEVGFETFVAGIGNTNTTYYAIVHQTANEFEVGLGTVSDSSPDTLSRTTIISSSNSDSGVNFSAGTKDVFCTLPASKAVFIDGSGDLEFNAPGDDFSFKNSSNTIAFIKTTNDDFTVQNNLNDKDFILKGYDSDGGGLMTGLTIDYSNAGKATFGGDVALADSKKLVLGAGEDLQLYHDGSNSYVADAGTGGLILRGTNTVDIQSALGHNYLKSTISAGTQIYYDNSEKFATVSGGVKVTGNIENASGDLTMDVAGDIILDADGGDIYFLDGGTTFGHVSNVGNNMVIKSFISDNDLVIQGNDGGSQVDALTFDMSNAGAATFNSTVSHKGSTASSASNFISSWNNTGQSYNGYLYADSGGAGIFSHSSAAIQEGIYFQNSTDKTIFYNQGAARGQIDGSGNVIFVGNITAYGSTSDIRLKENVEVIPDAINKVKQLKGITFNYKKDGKKSTGLIAQDLEKVLPEAVYESSDIDDDDDKHLAIRYGNTVGLLVEAIKEQQEQIETLTAKVKELEGK